MVGLLCFKTVQVHYGINACLEACFRYYYDFYDYLTFFLPACYPPHLLPLYGGGLTPYLGSLLNLGLRGTCKQHSPMWGSIALVVLKVARVGFVELRSRVYDDICQMS